MLQPAGLLLACAPRAQLPSQALAGSPLVAGLWLAEAVVGNRVFTYQHTADSYIQSPVQHSASATMVVSVALAPHPHIPKADKPVLVCILDGWGANIAEDEYNAIHVADTPTTDALKVGACPPHVPLAVLLVEY